MNSSSLTFSLIRQFIYLVLLTLIVVIFWQVADAFKASTVQEYGIFESAQSVVLFLTAISFIIQSIINKAYRPVLFSLSMLALAALVREQDAYFDTLIPLIGWRWCWLFPLLGLALIIHKWRESVALLPHFLRCNAFHMMMTALVIIIPVAQCLGHRSFLADMIGEQGVNTHLVRRIVEEPIELLGYIQILLASIESMFDLRKK